MWTMIITFLLYGDPSIGHFSPAVNSVEFKSKASCEAARTAYLAELKPIADALNASLKDQEAGGSLKPPNGVVISALCVAQ
jgi:hypothetical protein